MVQLAEMLAAKDPELAEAYGFTPGGRLSVQRPRAWQRAGVRTTSTRAGRESVGRSTGCPIARSRGGNRGACPTPRRRCGRPRLLAAALLVAPASPALAHLAPDADGSDRRQLPLTTAPPTGAFAARTSRRSCSRRPATATCTWTSRYVSLPPSPKPEMPDQQPDMAELGIYSMSATTRGSLRRTQRLPRRPDEPRRVDAPVDVDLHGRRHGHCERQAAGSRAHRAADGARRRDEPQVRRQRRQPGRVDPDAPRARAEHGLFAFPSSHRRSPSSRRVLTSAAAIKGLSGIPARQSGRVLTGTVQLGAPATLRSTRWPGWDRSAAASASSRSRASRPEPSSFRIAVAASAAPQARAGAGPRSRSGSRSSPRPGRRSRRARA